MEIQSARTMLNLKKGHFERENQRLEKYTLGDDLPAKLAQLTLRRPSAAAADAAGRDMKAPTWDYTVRRLTLEDKEEVLQFLRKFFFRDEPMNVAVRLLETPESRCASLEEYASSSLQDGVSLAAVDAAGRIVGVAVNGLAERREVCEGPQKAVECPDAKFRRILRVLAHLEQHARVWEHAAEADRVLEIRIVSTHASWRGRGLMRRLCEETESLAREIGAGALRMDATSAFSAAAAERLRYRRVYSVRYGDMEGAPRPEPPHTHASVYVKTLQLQESP